MIAGKVVQRLRDPAGREVIRFDTEQPWGVESVDGETQFDILPSQLVELEVVRGMTVVVVPPTGHD